MNETAEDADAYRDTAGDTTYCDHCGAPLNPGGHDSCRAARRLEPPRYCTKCRRRLMVQVTPRGWSARCSWHGLVDPSA